MSVFAKYPPQGLKAPSPKAPPPKAQWRTGQSTPPRSSDAAPRRCWLSPLAFLVAVLALAACDTMDFQGPLPDGAGADGGSYSIDARAPVSFDAGGVGPMMDGAGFGRDAGGARLDAGMPPSGSDGGRPSPRITDGLVAFYRFDDAAEGFRDRSGVAPALDLAPNTADGLSFVGGGLRITASTILSTTAPAAKIADAVIASNGFTVEAWIRPANLDLEGPARIVSMSSSTLTRNFTLGQGSSAGGPPGDRLSLRVRSTATDDNGMPGLDSPGASLTVAPTHVVATRTAAGATTIFVNGAVVAVGTTGGALRDWARDLPLVIANEVTGDRPWLGDVFLVAVYGRSLQESEILQNFAARPVP